jgi:2-polyprenyl-6-methoxyphenol hydroxylase-like FAD-dependent oxidoreductase
MPQRRALIIGGSLGGLIAAHLLRGIGWDAVVFERNAVDLPSRGAGIGTHSHLIEVLGAPASRSTTPWGSRSAT